MVEIKRILCPTDFSEFSQHALEQAVALARWYGSGITALHVFMAPVTMTGVAAYEGPAMLDRAPFSASHGADRAEELERFVAPVAAAGVPIAREVAEGAIVDEIVTHARALPADLIVMGTHGRSGFERLLLGSVAERVLRKAPCPVLTVPRKAAASTTVAFNRILCALDFSEPSLLALTYALSLAQEADATLVVAHVVELLPEGDARELELLDTPKFRARFEWSARERLTAAIPDGARNYCTIKEEIATGKAYKEILRLAAAHDVDLIVMGVHGRGAADLLPFGSTTQHIVRQAACPVLTLRGGK
jgi:nucleotide-binding universal stress UspA family protein